MKTSQMKILGAALSLAGSLWFSSSVLAHDGWGYRHRDAYNSYPNRYERSYRYGSPYTRYDRRYYRSGRPYWQRNRERGEYGALGHKYNKAMNRLERQEREAREKAYRKYGDNPADPRYRERQREIAEKYTHKRYKVERNTAKERAELYRDFYDR